MQDQSQWSRQLGHFNENNFSFCPEIRLPSRWRTPSIHRERNTFMESIYQANEQNSVPKHLRIFELSQFSCLFMLFCVTPYIYTMSQRNRPSNTLSLDQYQ